MPKERSLHKLDPMTDYCTRCGMSAEQALNTARYHCADTTNVVPVSHIIAGRRLAELCGT